MPRDEPVTMAVRTSSFITFLRGCANPIDKCIYALAQETFLTSDDCWCSWVKCKKISCKAKYIELQFGLKYCLCEAKRCPCVDETLSRYHGNVLCKNNKEL